MKRENDFEVGSIVLAVCILVMVVIVSCAMLALLSKSRYNGGSSEEITVTTETTDTTCGFEESTTITETTTLETTDTTTVANNTTTEYMSVTSVSPSTSHTASSTTTTSSNSSTETTSLSKVSTITLLSCGLATPTETTTTVPKESPNANLTYLGSFTGTYYRGATNPCRGGSGRTLIDCSCGATNVKGSVACRYIYSNYGYYVGDRTKVYIEVPSYPSMNGWYYVDDCCASYSVVDFYYPNYSTCPFRVAGVISVKMFI